MILHYYETIGNDEGKTSLFKDGLIITGSLI
jgi:hypothetical protein